MKTLHLYDMISYKRIHARHTGYRGIARALSLEEGFNECIDKIVQYLSN